MRHTEYKALFEGKINTHKELKTLQVAFSQLHLSLNPNQQELDMVEFQSRLRDGKGAQAVLQSFHADYESNDSDNTKRNLHGALLILVKVEARNVAQQGEAYDSTERMAEEILAAVMYELNNSGKYLIKGEQLQSEKVGNVHGYFGTRMSFSIKQQSVPTLTYRPTLFE